MKRVRFEYLTCILLKNNHFNDHLDSNPPCFQNKNSHLSDCQIIINENNVTLKDHSFCYKNIKCELTKFRVLISPLVVRSPNTSRFPRAAGELPPCYALRDLTYASPPAGVSRYLDCSQ